MSRLSSFRKRLAENDFLAGALAIVVVIAVIAGVSIYYLAPPNRQTVTFTTRDAAAVSAGEDVRVAGISVGKVKSVSLRDNDVQVGLEIDDTVVIGDRTRVEVQLLTAVGGYFVTLIPAGAASAGSKEIPRDRVSVPYTIADILQELPSVTDEVEGEPVDQTLAQVADGVSQNSASVRNAIDGLQTLATVMDEQKLQVESILDMAGNYLTTFDNSREYLFELIRKVNIVLSQFYTYRAGFSEAYRQLGGVLERVGVLAQFYLNHTDQAYAAVVAARDTVGRLNDSASGYIDRLEPVRAQLMRLTGAVEGANTDAQFVIDASAMCLPVPGRSC